MITLNEVTKTYPLGKGNSVTALHGVSLEINEGRIHDHCWTVWLR